MVHRRQDSDWDWPSQKAMARPDGEWATRRPFARQPWWEPVPAGLAVQPEGARPQGAPWSRFFAVHPRVEAVGVGSFGPLGLRAGSASRGHVTTTPKEGWAGVDLLGDLRAALGVPVALDTDVNAAALAEGRHGAARGCDTFCYVTVGTGIGGGAVVNGRLLHGLVHPEVGHMRVPHDRARDPFDGACPYHGDCLEGLASGTAIERRWGRRAEELSAEPDVWALESDYLAAGLANIVTILSPQLIVLGGGVTRAPSLLPLVRRRLRELLAGYLDAPELTRADAIGRYVVAPALGDRAGVIGAIELARAG